MVTTTKKTRKTITARKPTAKKTAATRARSKATRKSVATLAPARVTETKTTKITVVAPRADKPKKPKLVRDSFTIPKAEYAVLQELKQRAARAGGAVKRSELLRAGIKALNAMGDVAFAAALKAVPAIKTGRPASE